MLSDPRGVYGIHNVTFYRRSNGAFYGTLKVLDSSSVNIEGSTVPLMGGSSKYAWAVEDGENKVEVSLKFSQFENFLFEVFLGRAPTENAAETSGNCSTVVNKKGTSMVAATGIASVTVKAASKADLKFNKYVIVATDSNSVDVYAASDVDGARGTDQTFQNDLLKITATPLDLVSEGVTEIPGTGVEITMGASATALVTGDTATFSTRPINTKSTSVRIGSAAYQTMPEFGMIILAQKRGNEEMTELDLFRCKGSGMPLGFEKNAWASAEVKVQAFYDASQDGVFDFRHVTPA